FPSRRRHTICSGDWSSDVCSSDLHLRLFAKAQHFDVVPDMLCFGKKAQVCGVLAGPRLDEVAENVFRKPGRINSTWGGNLVDMEIGRASCRERVARAGVGAGWGQG